MIARRTFVAALGACAVLAAVPAFAHHGWGWTTGANVELTGTIQEVKLGNPHGEVTLEVEGETWTVEVGQPWRNDRVGLTPEMLSTGAIITVDGEPSANMEEKRVKAERILIDGEVYDLYPGRN